MLKTLQMMNDRASYVVAEGLNRVADALERIARPKPQADRFMPDFKAEFPSWPIRYYNYRNTPWERQMLLSIAEEVAESPQLDGEGMLWALCHDAATLPVGEREDMIAEIEDIFAEWSAEEDAEARARAWELRHNGEEIPDALAEDFLHEERVTRGLS